MNLMKAYIYLLLFLFLQKLAFSQSGPHKTSEKIMHVVFSNSGDRFLTLTASQIAMWEAKRGKLVWIKNYTDFNIPKPQNTFLYPRANEAFNYLFIRDYSGYVLDLNNFTGTKVNNAFKFLYGDKLLIDNWNGQQERLYSIADVTGKIEQELGMYYSVNSSEDGTLIFCRTKKSSKTFDLIQNKWVKDLKQIPSRPSTPKVEQFNQTTKIINGNSTVSYDFSTRKAFITQQGQRKDLPILEGAGVDEVSKFVNYEKSEVYLLEVKTTMLAYPNFIAQSYLSAYSVPSGELLWRRELSEDPEVAKKQIQEAEEKKRKEREEMLAKADPEFKKFDAQFTNLSIPYTLNYDNAQGFELTGNSYIQKALYPKTGTRVYGMGRICSCDGNYSYLVMFRTQDQYKDLSNFIIVSFDMFGKSTGSQNIGTTQKDNAGVVKSIFTITGAGCNYSVASSTTWPNGHVDKKNATISNCKVNY